MSRNSSAAIDLTPESEREFIGLSEDDHSMEAAITKMKYLEEQLARVGSTISQILKHQSYPPPDRSGQYLRAVVPRP